MEHESKNAECRMESALAFASHVRSIVQIGCGELKIAVKRRAADLKPSCNTDLKLLLNVN